jgi:hypothetical protein
VKTDKKVQKLSHIKIKRKNTQTELGLAFKIEGNQVEEAKKQSPINLNTMHIEQEIKKVSQYVDKQMDTQMLRITQLLPSSLTSCDNLKPKLDAHKPCLKKESIKVFKSSNNL